MNEKKCDCMVGYKHTPPYLNFVRRSDVVNVKGDEWTVNWYDNFEPFEYCPLCGIKVKEGE